MPKKVSNWMHALSRGPLFRLGLVTGMVGLILVSLPPLGVLSYDLSYMMRPRVMITNAVLVLFDDITLEELHSVNNELSRMSHAQLLERLSNEKDKARLVFYDVIFTEPNPRSEVDQKLAHAIAEQGAVVLAAGSRGSELNGHPVETVTKPLPLLRKAARGWGHTELYATFFGGQARRQISPDCGDIPYAVWVAATNLQPGLLLKSDPILDRWLGYYGPPGSRVITDVRFEDVLPTNGPTAIPVGFFKDKIVFIGERANTLGKIGSRRETFPTPYSFFGYAPMAGVEIHATALLNLIRDDWLRPTPLLWQGCAACLWGIVISSTLYSLSRKPKGVLLLVAAAGAVLLSISSVYLQWHAFHWWSWLGPAFGQTATALVLVTRSPKQDRYIAFISYRTEEDGAAALLIARSLADRGFKAFIDVRSLHAGKFDEQLLHEIEAATFFILMLSPNSLARCLNEGDWVLKELAHALANRKQIIPVLKGGFNFDAPQGVPDLPQIDELRNYHGVAYSNSDFDGFMDRLMALLKLS